ncbi:hypothetical protein LXL04_036045 [Taraxacum kok-saghyz]
MNEDDGGWSKVNRRRRNKEITSFYVTNLQADVTVVELRKAFHSHGKLVDVYISGRKDKSSSFFAFVRFEGVKDTAMMVNNLNKVRCGNCIVKTNVARYEQRTEAIKNPKPYTRPAASRQPYTFRQNAGTTSTGFTFATVVSSGNNAPPNPKPNPPPPPIPLVQMKPVNSMDSCNSMCLIGEVKEFQMLSDIPKLLKIDGQTPARSYYAGGLKVILKFSSPSAAAGYLQEHHKWNRWFNSMKSGFVEEDTLASSFGRVLEADGHNWETLDVSVSFVVILTNSLKGINSELIGEISGKKVMVGVIEHENCWEPFLESQFPNSPLSDDEEYGEKDMEDDEIGDSEDSSDEEAVSETWENPPVRKDLEDGEIFMDTEKPSMAAGADDGKQPSPGGGAVTLENSAPIINNVSPAACMGTPNACLSPIMATPYSTLNSNQPADPGIDPTPTRPISYKSSARPRSNSEED